MATEGFVAVPGLMNAADEPLRQGSGVLLFLYLEFIQ